MMKTKLLLAGLVASAAFVGCTNDELIETTGSINAAKGETTLIFDGMGGVGTKMAYDGGFKWQIGDLIGVRRAMGDIVISNVKFEANKVTDDNTTDPETWNDKKGAMGDYAYFNSQDETLHEANYIVTYPYDPESVQDGKVIGRLPVAQVANEDNGTAYANNEYAGNYGFMMSEATHFVGGQNTGHFILYPVFSRIEIKIANKSEFTDVHVQSVILESKDGSAIFPTELEVGADVKVAADGYLDAKYMTPVESSKVNQIVMTMANDGSNDANKLEADLKDAKAYYMTLIPGTYNNIQLRINTDQGSYIREISGEQTFKTAECRTLNAEIEKLTPNVNFVVASAADWKQVMGNIEKAVASQTMGTDFTINVMGDITIPAADFRAVALNEKYTTTINGNGSITVDGDLNSTTSSDVNSLGIMNFNVPVTVDGDFVDMQEGDQLTFSELTVKGDFLTAMTDATDMNSNMNFTSLTVNKGVVEGATMYDNGNEKAVLTIKDVDFKGLVTVAAVKNGVDAYGNTKVNFNNCTFEGGLTVAENWVDGSAVVATINGATISNEDGDATLTVNGDYATTLYLKGNVIADAVKVEATNNVLATLDIISGTLSTNALTTGNDAAKSNILVREGAALTLGEDVDYTANAAIVKTEGTLTNNGTFTVADGVEMTDIENDGNFGKFVNNGLLFVPSANWYDKQGIAFAPAGDYVFTNIASVAAFKSAAATPGITGIQLTGTSYEFDKDVDYSNIDIYMNMTSNATIKAVNGKFGNLTVSGNSKTLTLKNGEKSTIEFGNVVVNAKLTIDNDSRNNGKNATTLKCNSITVNKGATLTNAAQLDCDKDKIVNNGTITQ